MKIEKENLKINNEEREFYILCYYEGIKEEVNLEQNYLLVWYDYKKNGELWFLIKTNQNLLDNYLSNKLPLLNLIKSESSKIYLYERNYASYDKLGKGSDITLYLDKHNLPDSDAYLGRNFLQFLGINRSTTYNWENMSIRQSLLPGIVEIMPIKSMSFTTTFKSNYPNSFDAMRMDSSMPIESMPFATTNYAAELFKSVNEFPSESGKSNDEPWEIAA